MTNEHAFHAVGKKVMLLCIASVVLDLEWTVISGREKVELMSIRSCQTPIEGRCSMGRLYKLEAVKQLSSPSILTATLFRS